MAALDCSFSSSSCGSLFPHQCDATESFSNMKLCIILSSFCQHAGSHGDNSTGGGTGSGSGTGDNLTISFHLNTTLLSHSGDWVTVTWENVDNPSPEDWIGVYSPPVSGTVDAKHHAPIKFQVCLCSVDSQTKVMKHLVQRLATLHHV